jgi:hypothetical protein
MSKITLSNYEEWFMDFADGNLSSENIRMLHQFVNLHPSVQCEWELWNQIKLDSDSIDFYSQPISCLPALKEELDHDDMAYIQLLEGDVTSEQKAYFLEQIVVSDDKKKIMKMFAQTKLAVDVELVWPAKRKMLRRGFQVNPLIRWSIAACLLISLGSYFFFNTMNHDAVSTLTLPLTEKENQETAIISEHSEELLVDAHNVGELFDTLVYEDLKSISLKGQSEVRPKVNHVVVQVMIPINGDLKEAQFYVDIQDRFPVSAPRFQVETDIIDAPILLVEDAFGHRNQRVKKNISFITRSVLRVAENHQIIALDSQFHIRSLHIGLIQINRK